MLDYHSNLVGSIFRNSSHPLQAVSLIYVKLIFNFSNIFNTPCLTKTSLHKTQLRAMRERETNRAII